MIMESDLNIVGREVEIAILENAYEKSRNVGQYAWIQGASGVGKTTLIERFIHDKPRACIGKFDFVQTSAPYSAVVSVLAVGYLLRLVVYIQ